MPRLTDISIVKIGKHVAPDSEKALIQYSLRQYKLPPLTIANKLRTTVKVVDAYQKPAYNYQESSGAYASWCDELNRSPKTDCFTLSPINTVKSKEDDEIKALELAVKHKKWLEGVKNRMQEMGFNP